MNTNIEKNNTSAVYAKAPTAAVELLKQRLPEISNKMIAVNRSNSQTTLAMMSLTMLNGQSPMRQLRQVMAEISQRQTALASAQVDYQKIIEMPPEQGDSDELMEAKQRHKSFSINSLESSIAGAIKELAVLISVYDEITKKHNLEEWTEEDYEKSEAKHHVRRAFELLYRNTIEYGRPKESTLEYLQQFGIHVQLANKEVVGYIAYIEKMIEDGERPSSSNLEDFLDLMADKYEYCVREASMRMYGVENITNRDFMNTWKS